MGGNAGAARAQDRMLAILALDRAAARTGRTLVAGKVGATEIDAARALHQVAADSRHVTHLRRGAGQEGGTGRRGEPHRVLLVGSAGVGEGVGHAGLLQASTMADTMLA